jgi:hypothetical protein
MIRTLHALTPLVGMLLLAMPASAADGGATDASVAVPYAFAYLATVLILFTICKPSKKSVYED